MCPCNENISKSCLLEAYCEGKLLFCPVISYHLLCVHMPFLLFLSEVHQIQTCICSVLYASGHCPIEVSFAATSGPKYTNETGVRCGAPEVPCWVSLHFILREKNA